MEGNGTPVSRAELAAHIKGIDEHFDAIEDSILRIEELLKDRKNSFRAWMPPLVAALVSAGVALPIAFIH